MRLKQKLENLKAAIAEGEATYTKEPMEILEELKVIEGRDEVSWADAIAIKGNVEELLGGEVSWMDFEDYCLDMGWLDVKTIRRRIEDYLRKDATDQTITRVASFLGVNLYSRQKNSA